MSYLLSIDLIQDLIVIFGEDSVFRKLRASVSFHLNNLVDDLGSWNIYPNLPFQKRPHLWH